MVLQPTSKVLYRATFQLVFGPTPSLVYDAVPGVVYEAVPRNSNKNNVPPSKKSIHKNQGRISMDFST